MPLEFTEAPKSQTVTNTENPLQERHEQHTYRSRELEWLRTHKEALQQFAGQWIVLEGEEIVASGDNPLQVVAEARAKGIQIPYVIHLEVTGENEVRIGL